MPPSGSGIEVAEHFLGEGRGAGGEERARSAGGRDELDLEGVESEAAPVDGADDGGGAGDAFLVAGGDDLDDELGLVEVDVFEGGGGGDGAAVGGGGLGGDGVEAVAEGRVSSRDSLARGIESVRVSAT